MCSNCKRAQTVCWISRAKNAQRMWGLPKSKSARRVQRLLASKNARKTQRVPESTVAAGEQKCCIEYCLPASERVTQSGSMRPGKSHDQTTN